MTREPSGEVSTVATPSSALPTKKFAEHAGLGATACPSACWKLVAWSILQVLRWNGTESAFQSSTLAPSPLTHNPSPAPLIPIFAPATPASVKPSTGVSPLFHCSSAPSTPVNQSQFCPSCTPPPSNAPRPPKEVHSPRMLSAVGFPNSLQAL